MNSILFVCLSLSLSFSLSLSETRSLYRYSLYVFLTGLELTEILLLQLLWCEDYRQEPLYQAYFSFLTQDLNKLPRLALNEQPSCFCFPRACLELQGCTTSPCQAPFFKGWHLKPGSQGPIFSPLSPLLLNEGVWKSGQPGGFLERLCSFVFWDERLQLSTLQNGG